MRTFRRLTAVMTLAAVAALAAGCDPSVPGKTPAGPPATAAVSPEFNDADVTFLRTLIPHHRAGTEIARIGAERASRPELRTLAGAVVATQQDEVARLSGWLTAWGRTAPPAPAKPPQAVTTLAKTSRTAFDAAFARLLAGHQREAVRLAEAETANGRNRDALAFARQVQASRTAQIDALNHSLRKT
ncbi:DUF305 domain-containing protein [Actinoplanes sp. NPDC049681]|uniref:DUF305 domain-containing protein n=1 Tax=Actinoplanes sp. NPDC049681 TaxID=3363905 RepID=UPI0037BC48EB